MPKHIRRCPNCDQPDEGDGTLFGLCPKCKAELEAPVRVGVDPDGRVQIWRAPLPAPGIHVAGALEGPHRRDQYCTRCRALLASSRLPGEGPIPMPNTVPYAHYPVGALIERGTRWQAMNLSATVPTCREASDEGNTRIDVEDRAAPDADGSGPGASLGGSH